MKASIVLATYNRLPKLKKCLKRLLNQDFNGYELIITDDGSSDGTWKYLEVMSKKYKKLKVFRQKNQGPAVARNKSVRAAKGEYVFFTDDDVLMPSNWLSSFVKVLEENPRVAAVGGVQMPSKKKQKESIFARYEAFKSKYVYHQPESLYIGGFETYGCVTNNAAYRRKVLEEVELFDESFPVPGGEDADLKLRVVKKGHKLAFYPIIGEHIQDYSLKGFARQQFTRGIGSKHFSQKHRNTNFQHNKNSVKAPVNLWLPHIISILFFYLGTIKYRYYKK